MRWAREIHRRLPVAPAAAPAVLLLAVLLVIGATQSSRFLSGLNLSNVLIQTTPLLIVALGQMIVVASRGLDLSVGSVVSLVTVIVASLAGGMGLLPALVIGIAAALLVGLVNGAAVAWGIDGFLTTLATLFVVQGLCLFILETPGGSVPEGFGDLAGFFGGASGVVPLALPIVLLIALGTSLFLRHSRTGLHILAIGSDRRVARLCGVPITRALLIAYCASAGFAALAGIFVTARTLGGDPLGGATFTLDSLAVVVLGGTMLDGGRATVFGTVVAALAIGFLSNVMNWMQVSDYWQTPVKGGVVIAAVLIPALSTALARALRRRMMARSYGEAG